MDPTDNEFDTATNPRLCLVFSLCYNPIVPVGSFGSIDDEGILEGDPISNFKPNLNYKVDSFIPITTKPMVDKLRAMFEILNDIEIILPGSNIIYN